MVFSQKLYENYLRSQGMTNQALIASLRQEHALKMISSTLLDYALVSQSDRNISLRICKQNNVPYI